MLQDIAPHSFSNAFASPAAAKGDILLCFDHDHVLLRETENGIVFPRIGEVDVPAASLIYLFSLDDERYFLCPPQLKVSAAHGLARHAVSCFRGDAPQHLAFAGITGWQLYRWYRDHRLCGACGEHHLRSFEDAPRLLR